MRVNIDSKALKDPRFKRLGKELGVSRYEALGLCIELWMYASEQRSEFLTADDVDAVVDREGFGDALVAADLAEADEQRLRLRGVRARIGWLDRQAEKGRAGGLASAAARRTKKSAHIEPGAEAPAQRVLKQRGSDHSPSPDPSPSPAQDLFPDHAPNTSSTASPSRASGTNTAIAYFFDRYKQRYAHSCSKPGRHAKGVLALVEQHTVEEVRRRIDILFDSPPPFLSASPPDLGTLVQHFDKLVVGALSAPTNGKHSGYSGRVEPATAAAHARDAALGTRIA